MNTLYGSKNMAIALLAAASIVPDIATARVADQNTDSSSVAVQYADLNLASDDGVAVLYRRLQTASRRVCGNNIGKTTLHEARLIKLCSDEALNNAVQATGSQRLIALHSG